MAVDEKQLTEEKSVAFLLLYNYLFTLYFVIGAIWIKGIIWWFYEVQ